MGPNRTLTAQRLGKEGSGVEFFDKMMKDFGVTRYEVVPITDKSKAYSVSSFTQCIHEVALNNADVCLSLAWATTSRMYAMSPHGVQFTRSVYNADMRLITKKASPVSNDEPLRSALTKNVA